MYSMFAFHVRCYMMCVCMMYVYIYILCIKKDTSAASRSKEYQSTTS